MIQSLCAAYNEGPFTWFGKYAVSFRYANVNKDVHDIRNFNMEVCGSYIMVFSSSHTYVKEKIKTWCIA